VNRIYGRCCGTALTNASDPIDIPQLIILYGDGLHEQVNSDIHSTTLLQVAASLLRIGSELEIDTGMGYMSLRFYLRGCWHSAAAKRAQFSDKLWGLCLQTVFPG
jgi:hypothetical protein